MSTRSRAAFAGLATATALLLAGCGDDPDTAKDTSGSAPASGPTCEYSTGGPSASKEVTPPPDRASVSDRVELTMATSVGDIGLELDADTTPCTVNSFVSLAEQGYFDQTSCHRLTTDQAGIFVLQCGDPTGSGMGGPGYSFDDELSGDETYPAGTLAMANAGPDTNGSQFFIVYEDTPLPPSYTVFGTVDAAGLKVVRNVAAQGTTTGGPDGEPKETVAVETVTVDG
jgi:peptidyl-prolyl cis-trans isomerase B (cyclophilin B)